MRSRDLAVLMFVALGVFTLVAALGLASSLFALFQYPSESAGRAAVLGRVAALVPFLALLWIAARLIRYREHYAQLVVDDSADRPASLDSDDLAVIGVSLVGLNCVITAIPSFLQWGAQLLFTNFAAESTGGWSPAEYLRMAAGQFGWATGLLLLGMVTVLLRHRIADFTLSKPAPRTPKTDAPASAHRRKCPTCGESYDPNDYRSDAETIYCTNCRAEIPRTDSDDA